MTSIEESTLIRRDDLVESIAAALQYISYYHPADYIQHLAHAWQQSPASGSTKAPT